MSEAPTQGQPDDALMDLLIKQTLEGLSPAEQRALDAFDAATAASIGREVERAVAAVTLAAPVKDPLPAALRSRLEQQADAHVGANVIPLRPTAAPTAAGPAPAARASRSGSLGWLAAAACLVLAVVGWLRTPVEAPTPSEERAALVAKADVIQIPLGATKDPAAAGVSGDVVWDPKTQKGYLRFVGLAPNDPAVHQYQIWVFDGGRDNRYPVDGGVFNVPAGATDVVIPIHAALPILQPAAFAVTVEKPGGVVVSARDHVVVLGAVGA